MPGARAFEEGVRVVEPELRGRAADRQRASLIVERCQVRQRADRVAVRRAADADHAGRQIVHGAGRDGGGSDPDRVRLVGESEDLDGARVVEHRSAVREVEIASVGVTSRIADGERGPLRDVETTTERRRIVRRVLGLDGEAAAAGEDGRAGSAHRAGSPFQGAQRQGAGAVQTRRRIRELEGTQGAVRAGRIGGGPEGERGHPREQGVVPASAVQRHAGRALRPDLAAVQGRLAVEGGVAVDHERQRGAGRVDGGGDGDRARVHGARAGVQRQRRGAGARVIDGAGDRDAVVGLYHVVGRSQVAHDRGRQRGVDGHSQRIEQESAAAADDGAGIDARADDVRRVAAGKLDEATVAAEGAGAGGEITLGREGAGGLRDETAAAGLA